MKRRTRILSVALAAVLTGLFSAPAALAEPAPSTGPLWMVALGDSVASGEGIGYGWHYLTVIKDGKLKDGQWVADHLDNPAWIYNQNAPQPACHVSKDAYPIQVASAMGWHLQNLACTGATARNGLLTTQDLGNGIHAHWPQIGSAQPGYDPPNPIYGFEGSHYPDVVTLTLGADDIDFGHFVRACYVSADPKYNAFHGGFNGGGFCDKNDEVNADISRLLADQLTGLDRVVTEIIHRNLSVGKPAPAIFLTTYYDPLPANYETCSDILPKNLTIPIGSIDVGLKFGLSPGEVTWMKARLGELNANIRTVAGRHPEVTLVPLDDVFKGHEWCTLSPYAFGPSIATLPGQLTNPSPFHPTAAGQTAIANRVQAMVSQHFFG